METEISINKIISILIAIVVASCVLIPICNELGNNGNSGESRLGAYENPGNKLSKIDLNDTSKTYTFSIDDGYEVGDAIVLTIQGDSGGLISEYVFGWIYTEIDGIGYTFADMYGMADYQYSQIRLAYNFEDSEWWIEVYYDGEFMQYATIPSNLYATYVADDNGEYYGSLNPTTLDNFPQIKLGDNSTYGIIWEYFIDDKEFIYSSLINENGTILHEFKFAGYYDGDLDDNIEYEIISSPTLTINEQGFVEISNPKLVYLDNGDEIEVQMGSGSDEVDEYLIMGGVYSQFVEIQSDGPTPGSDSGIAGTLITIIPVFVLLAILGSVAYMFVNRNETD